MAVGGVVERRLGTHGAGPGYENYVRVPPVDLVLPAVQAGTNPNPASKP